MDELRAGLELATDDELRQLTDILFRRRFNPLDYALGDDPIHIRSQERQAWLDQLEKRFRYLAADGVTVLQKKTEQMSYRCALIRVCHHLNIDYSDSILTTDLEAEIFLHVLGRSWKRLPLSEQQQIRGQIQHTVSQSALSHQLPPMLQRDPLALLVKGGSALALSAVIRPWLLREIARQFALHAARYQVAQQVLLKGGTALATQIQQRAVARMASRGMALSAARYSAVRTVFAFLGPAMWVYFFADLGWRAIATNYGRIIPVIIALAEIRLTRSNDWEAAIC